METLFNIAVWVFILSGVLVWLLCVVAACFFWLCQRPPTN